MALERSHAYGASLALLAAFGFSLKAIFVKLAYPHGVDAITLLACAGLVIAIAVRLRRLAGD